MVVGLIRKATKDDLMFCMELFKRGLEENGITDYHDSLILNKIIVSYHQAPCFLLEKDDKVIGMASLNMGVISYSGKPILVDNMFYIRPENRSLENLNKLVKSCKDFAEEHSLPLRFDFLSNDNEKLQKRLYRMNGIKVLSVTGVYDASSS